MTRKVSEHSPTEQADLIASAEERTRARRHVRHVHNLLSLAGELRSHVLVVGTVVPGSYTHYRCFAELRGSSHIHRPHRVGRAEEHVQRWELGRDDARPLGGQRCSQKPHSCWHRAAEAVDPFDAHQLVA